MLHASTELLQVDDSTKYAAESLIYQPLDISPLVYQPLDISLLIYAFPLANLPEEAGHGVAGSIVQWSVVLVGLSVCGVGIQSLPELLVALIQLAGEHLIPVDESLPEFGCRVAHRFF